MAARGSTPANSSPSPPFERVGKSPPEKPIFALRLGNARYPHMKMQIQPWDARHGFLLSVNTHDHALALDPNAPDAAAFMALQAENQRLKVEIEQAWDEAGLPTFPRYLRDYLAGQNADGPSLTRLARPGFNSTFRHSQPSSTSRKREGEA